MFEQTHNSQCYISRQRYEKQKKEKPVKMIEMAQVNTLGNPQMGNVKLLKLLLNNGNVLHRSKLLPCR